jgi:hypothetical protein
LFINNFATATPAAAAATTTTATTDYIMPKMVRLLRFRAAV